MSMQSRQFFADGSEALQILQYFLGMRLRFLHRWPVLDDIAVRPNDHGGTDSALNFLAIHRLFAEGAIIFHDDALRIGKQDVGQLEFLGKFVVRVDAVLADTDYDGIGLFELRIQLAEPASFLGSARSTVLWVEKQHNRPASELIQRVLLPIIPWQAERRRLATLKVFHRCDPLVSRALINALSAPTCNVIFDRSGRFVGLRIVLGGVLFT